MVIADSVRDPVGANGQGDKSGDITNIEIRKSSEVEQEVSESTGLQRRPIYPHSDGYKDAGKDGDDRRFGKSFVKERPLRHTGGMRFVPQIVPVTRKKDATIVDFCFGFQGKYHRYQTRENATHEEVEIIGRDYFGGNVALIDFPTPLQDKFKAMYFQDPDNAAWTRCDRTDMADEEWILTGQEFSDLEITKIVEER
jgi:hypothetical protein